MAYLDNSGDIILDAVLTDTGRYRLAKGDGSFKVTKYAFGDDEINYALFNGTHASGSAYYDLQILQTPVLEAFTNNTSTMKSKLVTFTRNNLYYLPTIMLNLQNDTKPGGGNLSSGYFHKGADTKVGNMFVVAVDKDTEDVFDDYLTTATFTGLMKGETPSAGSDQIRIDQGLNTNEIPPSYNIDPDLEERQYIIEVDHRFARIVSPGGTPASLNFIDDDNIASYYLTLNTDSGFVTNNQSTEIVTSSNNKGEVVRGPRGTTLQFKIQSSIDLNTSTYLFSKFGTGAGQTGLWTLGTVTFSTSPTFYYLDSTIRVTGVNTGYRLDLPVRFIKLKD